MDVVDRERLGRWIEDVFSPEGIEQVRKWIEERTRERSIADAVEELLEIRCAAIGKGGQQ